MKTLYHPKNRSKNLYKNKILFVFGLFIFCIIFFSILGGLLVRAGSGVWWTQNVLTRSVGNFFSLVHSKQTLINENEALQAQIAKDDALLNEAKSTQIQLDNLLSTYGRNSKTSFIAGAVISRPPQTLFDTLILDVGESDGVRIGDKVSVPNGAKIGHITEVFSHNSKVKLYSSNDEKQEVVFERNRVSALLVGHGGGSFVAILPKDTEVVAGDRVLSSDIEATLVGVVENIESTATDSFKAVLVRSVANVFNIQLVSISHE